MLEYHHKELNQPLSQVSAVYLREIIDGIHLQSDDGADMDLVRRLAAIFLAERG